MFSGGPCSEVQEGRQQVLATSGAVLDPVLEGVDGVPVKGVGWAELFMAFMIPK